MTLKALSRFALILTAALAPSLAFGAEPTEWQMGFQPAATPIMREVTAFHNLLLAIITVITLFVLGLLIYVVVKFNAKANPTPRKFSHNTLIEVIWTGVPVAILLIIAIPSFKLLYNQDVIPEADLTLKVTGYQWYWGYEYPDQEIPEMLAYMMDDEGADARDLPRRLATMDPGTGEPNYVVVPVNKTVRVLVTAADVIHSWAMPSFGVKMDAVTGRLNETWFRAEREGIYYGQCSEICGVKHAYMPIAVKVVSDAEFEIWADQQRELAGLDPMYSESKVALAD